MSGRLKAIWLLALALFKTLLRRLFRRGLAGIGAFRSNYDADGLPPVTEAERAQLGSFGRCIACGLCDRGEAERIEASGGAYQGVMALVLAASRSMPDFRAAARSFTFVPDGVLREKELICPARVPFREMAQFVREKAEAVGGLLPAPSSMGPRSASGLTRPSGL